MSDFYDTFHRAYARELGRIVQGITLDVGDNEQGIEERTVTVDHLVDVTVGVDSNGIFAGIGVEDTDGDEWILYSDGTIAEYETDRTVGRHTLKTMPRTEVQA